MMMDDVSKTLHVEESQRVKLSSRGRSQRSSSSSDFNLHKIFLASEVLLHNWPSMRPKPCVLLLPYLVLLITPPPSLPPRHPPLDPPPPLPLVCLKKSLQICLSLHLASALFPFRQKYLKKESTLGFERQH